MKSLLFASAIFNRNRVRFLYGLNEIILEPYCIGRNKTGNKVLYGRLQNSNEVKMFEYGKILNIKVLPSNKFSPIIPIVPSFN